MRIALGEKGPTIGRGLNGAIAVVIGMVIAVPFPAAASADLSNTGTGGDSSNTNSVTADTSVETTVTNSADITQNFTLNLNTGGNTITNNSEVGDVATGDVQYDIQSETTANDTKIAFSDPTVGANASSLGSGDMTLSNSHTGSDSSSTNIVNQTSNKLLTLSNNLSVNNTVSLSANTGGNTVANNTKVGTISTGSISGQIAMSTTGNTVDIGGKGGGVTPPDTNGGERHGGGQAVVPGTNHTQTIAAATPQQQTIGGKGGGAFFPAGGNPVNAFQIFLLFLLTIAIVRFQSLLSAIGREFPLPIRC